MCRTSLGVNWWPHFANFDETTKLLQFNIVDGYFKILSAIPIDINWDYVIGIFPLTG